MIDAIEDDHTHQEFWRNRCVCNQSRLAEPEQGAGDGHEAIARQDQSSVENHNVSGTNRDRATEKSRIECILVEIIDEKCVRRGHPVTLLQPRIVL